MYEFWFKRSDEDEYLSIKNFYKETFEAAVEQFDGWASLCEGDNTFRDKTTGWIFQIRKASIE